MTDSTKVKASADAGGLDSLDTGTGMIILKSKDNKSFEVDRKHASISNLVKTSLEQDSEASEIPIPSVRSEILAKVVEYMRYHEGKEPELIEKPLKSKNMKEVCSKHPWDADFIDGIGAKRQDLYDLILAANYMDIKSLLHLGCAKVASLIKGVPLDKIRNYLDPNAVDGDKKPDSDVKKDD